MRKVDNGGMIVSSYVIVDIRNIVDNKSIYLPGEMNRADHVVLVQMRRNPDP